MTLLIALSLLNVVALSAATLDDLTARPDSDYPLSDTARRRGASLEDLALLPDVPAALDLRSRYADFKPEITVQKLYRINLPSGIEDDSLFAAVLNSLGAPETQVGYTYHSATRNDDVVLFKASFISDAKGKRAKGFTYTQDSLPPTLSYYQYVDEANFSGTVLRQVIEVAPGYLSFRSTNTERIWYSVIPILKEGGSRSEMLFFRHGSHLYVYSATQLADDPSKKKLPVSLHVPSMFGKRMDVMAHWLEDRLKESLK